MLIAQEYAPDISELKKNFLNTPLGLLFLGKNSDAVNKLGLDAKNRVEAMTNPESALQVGMDFMGGGLLGTVKNIGKKSYPLNPDAKVSSDIPSIEWLNEKRQRAQSRDGYGNIKAHLGNALTGGFGGNYPVVPIKVLKEIQGLNLEQLNKRPSSLEYLEDFMRRNNTLPTNYFGDSDIFRGSKGRYLPLNVEGVREYKPFLQVDQYGQPFVSEGNHRIMIADKLGWENLPIELRYFEGGEIEKGLLNPELIQKYNRTGNPNIFDEELQKYVEKVKTNKLITNYHRDRLTAEEILNRRLKHTRKK